LSAQTVAETSEACFEIEEIDRSGFAAQRLEPSIPHILGRARRSRRSPQ